MSGTDQILERELREALAPERPEREAFGRGVRERIEELRADPERRLIQDVPDEPEEFGEPAQFTTAAGLFGPLLGAVGGAAGKSTFGKTVMPVLAMPVVIFASIALLLFAGLRSSRDLDASRDVSARSAKEVLRWWELYRGALFPAAAGLLYLGWTGSFDVLLALLVLSMLSMLVALRGFSARGLASRRVISQQAGGFLTSVGVWFYLLGGRSLDLRNDPVQLGMVYGVTTLVGFACLYAGRSDMTAAERKRHASPFLALPFVLVVFGLFAYLIVYLAPVRSGASVEELTAWAESEEPADTVDWSILREVTGALKRAGAQLPELRGARVALDKEPLVDLSRFSQGDAAEIGLLSDADYQRILDSRAVSRRMLMEKNGDLGNLAQKRILVFAMQRVANMRSGERYHIAERLLASWQDDDRYAKLEDLREILVGLDFLGRPDLVPSLEPAVEKALLDAWLPDSDRHDHVGGFMGYYKSLRHFADLESTVHAVELMERFGVPVGIDLRLVHGYLKHEAQRDGLIGELGQFEVRPAAALLRFEAAFGDPSDTSLPATLWDWRYFGAVTALCGLCAAAVLRAPRTLANRIDLQRV